MAETIPTRRTANAAGRLIRPNRRIIGGRATAASVPTLRHVIVKKHLDEALERNAAIMVFGDFFCAMQGRYDPRRSLDSVRPEHAADNYLDLLVSTAAEFFAPYARNMALLSMGNHEYAVLKNNSRNLLDNLIYRLNTEHGGTISLGQHGGWLITRLKQSGKVRLSHNMWFDHGYGGGGPVTQDVIQTNRRGVYLPDADMIVNGHTHDAWALSRKRHRISTKGVPYNDIVWFVKTPSYKDAFGAGSWDDRTGKPPKPLGCAWAQLSVGVLDRRRALEARVWHDVQ